jgi:hypothetical protein
MWEAAKQALRDTKQIVETQPGAIAAFAFGAFLVAYLGEWMQNKAIFSGRSLTLLLIAMVITNALSAAVLVPWLIKVHRLIILNDRASALDAASQKGRFGNFFICSLLLTAMFVGMVFLPVLLVPGSRVASFILSLLLFIATVYVSTRIMLVFPAIATDASRASLSAAWSDTAGNAGFLFGAGFLMALPLVLAMYVIGAALAWVFGTSVVGNVILHVFTALAGVVIATASASLASRMYMRFARLLIGK